MGVGIKRALVNKNTGEVINPATSDKQDDIIYQLQENQKSFLFSVSRGDFPTLSLDAAGSSNQTIAANTEELVAVQRGDPQLLSADTEVFISSTEVADNQIVAIAAMNDEYEPITLIGTLNGRNQVSLGNGFRIFSLFPISGTSPTGDVYVAESDTLTGGVPDTASKIQIKMAKEDGIATNPILTVPKDNNGYFFDFLGSVEKGKNAKIFLQFGIAGGPLTKSPTTNVFENTFSFRESSGYVKLPAKTDIVVTARADTTPTAVTVAFQTMLEDIS